MIRTIGTGDNPKKYNLSDVIETLALSPADVERSIGLLVDMKTISDDIYISEYMFRKLLLESHDIGEYIKGQISLEVSKGEMIKVRESDDYTTESITSDNAFATMLMFMAIIIFGTLILILCIA